MGNEARETGRSCRTLLTIVRTLDSTLGAPGRHLSFKISFFQTVGPRWEQGNVYCSNPGEG